jgi:hypothetical protein
MYGCHPSVWLSPVWFISMVVTNSGCLRYVVTGLVVPGVDVTGMIATGLVVAGMVVPIMVVIFRVVTANGDFKYCSFPTTTSTSEYPGQFAT